MRRRELATTVLIGAVVLTAVGAASVSGAEDGAAPVMQVAPATSTSTTVPPTTVSPTTVPPTTAPPPPPTTAPPPPPPAPAPPPANPREAVPVVEIGLITIPVIGLHHPVYEGVSLTVIDRGPGHWPGTPMPGGAGNVVFGGHRVTHSHPFRDVDQLHPGDEIIFSMTDGSTAVYVVTEQFVVGPEALWIVDPTPGQVLTLFACHPKGSARQRIVIRAALKS